MPELRELAGPGTLRWRPAPSAAALARLEETAAGLASQGVDGACAACFVPGRVEVLGKHTDYAGGRSLTAAAEPGFCLVAVARSDRRLRLLDVAAGAGARAAELEIGAAPPPGSPAWLRYPATVARRLATDFPAAVTGATMAFSSDLPAAAGLASSSAFVTALFLAIARLGGLWDEPRFAAAVPSPETLGGYLGAVESGGAFGRNLSRALGRDDATAGVGTQGGSGDHTAIVCSRADRLGQYSYLPVARERSLAMPAGHVFGIACSGVVAEKAGGARRDYNRAARLAAESAAAWRRATKGRERHLAAALAAVGGSVEELAAAVRRGAPEATRDLLERRTRHFAEEHGRTVPAAGEALAAGDLRALGEICDRSQALADELLGNQTPETRALADQARRLGAAAASAFGAGFGGAVWALVEEEAAPDFLSRWRRDYLAAFPERRAAARFFATRAAPGAREIAADGVRPLVDLFVEDVV